MTRIQRQRTKGWRMPEGAIYVGRPSRWGNPWPVTGDIQPWLALALGQRADKAGRQASAVIAYRAWMTGTPLPVPTDDQLPDEGGSLEYSDGTVRKVSSLPVGMGLMMLARYPIGVPERPDIEPLRDATALVCWCGLDEPCHGDVLIELLA